MHIISYSFIILKHIRKAIDAESLIVISFGTNGMVINVKNKSIGWLMWFCRVNLLEEYPFFRNPFHKSIPQLSYKNNADNSNYPHKNNADNSIKIAFTNSELPKIIYTFFFYERPLIKTLKRRMSVLGREWPLTAPWKLSALSWNCVHKFRSLVPMQIIAATKKCGLFWPRSDFTTK